MEKQKGLLTAGVIGVGNAGGQIAQMAAKQGFMTLALNTSSLDLDKLKGVETRCIGDNMGAGKDRMVSFNFMRQNYKDFINDKSVIKMVDECDVVFVVNSTAGGTGSGLGHAVVQNLKYLTQTRPDVKLTIVSVYILPSDKESKLAQSNSIEFMHDIMKLNIPYMAYDNDRLSDDAGMTSDDVMATVNKAIIEDLCTLRGDYIKSSEYESIDNADLLRVISCPGRLCVLRTGEFDDVNKDVSELLLASYQNGTMAMFANEKENSVSYSAFIGNISQNMANYVDQFNPAKDLIGIPGISQFGNTHFNDKNSAAKNEVYVIYSGMHCPVRRLQQLVECKDRIQVVSQDFSELDDIFKKNISEFTSSKTEEEVAVSLDDFYK